MQPIISKIVVSGYENLKLVRIGDEIYVTKDKTIEEIYYPNMNKKAIRKSFLIFLPDRRPTTRAVPSPSLQATIFSSCCHRKVHHSP